VNIADHIDLTANQAPDENYWTTFYCGDAAFDIEGDACAYTATYTDGKLTLHNQGKTIPAATAVVIVGESSAVSLKVNASVPAFTGENALRGVDVDTPTSSLGTGTFYVLGMTTVNNEQHFGFHRRQESRPRISQITRIPMMRGTRWTAAVCRASPPRAAST